MCISTPGFPLPRAQLLQVTNCSSLKIYPLTVLLKAADLRQPPKFCNLKNNSSFSYTILQIEYF